MASKHFFGLLMLITVCGCNKHQPVRTSTAASQQTSSDKPASIADRYPYVYQHDWLEMPPSRVAMNGTQREERRYSKAKALVGNDVPRQAGDGDTPQPVFFRGGLIVRPKTATLSGFVKLFGRKADYYALLA